MSSTKITAWLSNWFDPVEPELRDLRYGQLMHVMATGRSALASSLLTVGAVAGIAAVWHEAGAVILFAAVGTAMSIIAHVLYLRAAAAATGPESYRVCNAWYIAHSFFVVAAMAAVGLLWTPGTFAENLFVLVVLVVCATVRAAHQAAHVPSSAMSLIYFFVGLPLMMSEATWFYAAMTALGLSVMFMLTDVNLRMYRTVEAMLKLSQSERALLNDQKRLLNELRDANEAKSHFMARMSHELRTPLNAVIGFSDVMMQETMGPVGTPVYVDYLKHIHSSGGHLLELINDILDLSKIEAGRFELRESEVDLKATAEEAFSMVQLRAQEGGVTLIDDIPCGVTLQADALSVRQMLINLLSNAVKFTPEGGAVRCTGGLRGDGALEIRVSDTGHGIPAEDLEWIFEPFGQSSSGYHARERGTGLGLPIVRSLMELHGGTARIESAPGEGTTAIIAFPARRVLAADIRSAA